MNPDYKNYSLIELYDVKENIDKERYPDRYKLLIDEIYLKEQNPEKVSESTNKDKESKLVFIKFVSALCAVFFSWQLMTAYKTGIIHDRGGHEYHLSTNPDGFYFIVGIHVFFLIFSTWLVFKKFRKSEIK